jgi:nitroimidazol reductase NimA-like FMN-containing flavoprotein (pyridoxamine 5'-phosphate oxidase superfamily)
VRRLPQRAAYDKATVHAILDAGRICHVGFISGGRPCVIPMLYARSGDTVYLHGSNASRMLRALAAGTELSLAVTLLDGYVLARSAFHHSVNYRSVVVFGKALLVEDPMEKMEALRLVTNHVVPGRWEEVRVPNERELKGTTVLAVGIEEASAKVRTGPPVDDEADYELPVWAGVVPVSSEPGVPQPDGRVPAGVEPFDSRRLK